MDEAGRRGRLRSFAIGSLVGAAGAIATARRASRRPRRAHHDVGLAAFEDAPCFLEIIGEEAQRLGDAGGETVTAERDPEPARQTPAEEQDRLRRAGG
jgi:hypothetical protein